MISLKKGALIEKTVRAWIRTHSVGVNTAADGAVSDQLPAGDHIHQAQVEDGAAGGGGHPAGASREGHDCRPGE